MITERYGHPPLNFSLYPLSFPHLKKIIVSFKIVQVSFSPSLLAITYI